MKARKIIIVVLAVIVLIPLLGFAGWFIKKGEVINLLIVNKSMLDFKGSENAAVNYVLNSEKILLPGGRRYKMEIDYIGLHWGKGDYQIKYPRLKEVSRVVENNDWFYFADASGILKSQVGKFTVEEDGPEYGGINNTDYTMIRELIELKKPVVLECSFLGPPTEPLVRYNLEKLIDVYYVGWTGRYVNDLSKNPLPEERIDWKGAYKKHTGEEWTFSGPGLILINDDAGRIVVLEEGRDIQTAAGLITSTDMACERFNLPKAVNYNGWLTILHPGNNTVHSLFDLNATESGIEKLRMQGLPEVFPALIETDENFYFLAGDFGKCKVNMLFSRVLGVNWIVSSLKGSGVKNPNNFFFTYYQPFMTEIIRDVKAAENLQAEQ